jgi:hypothetical protein
MPGQLSPEQARAVVLLSRSMGWAEFAKSIRDERDRAQTRLNTSTDTPTIFRSQGAVEALERILQLPAECERALTKS